MSIDVYKEWLGIPEGPRPPDHYALLRLVKFEDDLDKVESHYRKLNAHVRKYSTGKYMLESQRLLNELAKAKLCLTDSVRKREYDQSLGRLDADGGAAGGAQSILDVLIEQDFLSRDMVSDVETFAEARGLSLRDAVVQMKIAPADVAAAAFAKELGLPYLDLSETTPDDSVLDKIPRSVVKRHAILPLFIDDGVLLVACTHEPDLELEEEMQLRFGMPMRPVIATPLAVNQGIAKYYASGMRDESAAELAAQSSSGGDGKKGKKDAASKSKSKAESKPRPAHRSMEELDAGEAKDRRTYGILFICWSVIGSMLLDTYVLKPFILPAMFNWQWIPSPAGLIIPAIVIPWVVFSYWK